RLTRLRKLKRHASARLADFKHFHAHRAAGGSVTKTLQCDIPTLNRAHVDKSLNSVPYTNKYSKINKVRDISINLFSDRKLLFHPNPWIRLQLLHSKTYKPLLG